MALENLGKTSEEAEPPPQQDAACALELKPTKLTGIKERAVLETSTALRWLMIIFVLYFKSIPYIPIEAEGVTVKVAELGVVASSTYTPSMLLFKTLPLMVTRT